MPFLKHDYQEMSPLTLYVANSTQSPSHIWLLSFSGTAQLTLSYLLLRREKSDLRALTLSHVTFPAWSPPTTAAI